MAPHQYILDEAHKAGQFLTASASIAALGSWALYVFLASNDLPPGFAAVGLALGVTTTVAAGCGFVLTRVTSVTTEVLRRLPERSFSSAGD